MPKFVCPHCQQESITLKQKIFLNGVNPMRCGNCGALLKSSYIWGALSMLPYLGFTWALLNDLPVVVVLTFLSGAVSISLIVHMTGPIVLDKKWIPKG